MAEYVIKVNLKKIVALILLEWIYHLKKLILKIFRDIACYFPLENGKKQMDSSRWTGLVKRKLIFAALSLLYIKDKMLYMILENLKINTYY